MVTGKLKTHKSPGIDQIPVELIKAGGRTIRSEIHRFLLIRCGIRRNCLRSGRNRSLYLFKRRAIKHCSKHRSTSLLSTRCKILSIILMSRLTPYAEEIIGDHLCGF